MSKIVSFKRDPQRTRTHAEGYYEGVYHTEDGYSLSLKDDVPKGTKRTFRFEVEGDAAGRLLRGVAETRNSRLVYDAFTRPTSEDTVAFVNRNRREMGLSPLSPEQVADSRKHVAALLITGETL